MHGALLHGPRGIRLRIAVPETRPERRRGLLGRDRLAPDEGMLFPGARSIHTIGMRFEITAVLLGVDLRVREALRLPPHRVLVPRPRTRHVLECAADVDLRPGDRLRLAPADREGAPARVRRRAAGRYTSRRCPRRRRAPIV